MQMRKDLIIIVNLENGKAQLEFKLPEEFLTERRETEMRMEIWETAGGGRLFFMEIIGMWIRIR